MVPLLFLKSDPIVAHTVNCMLELLLFMLVLVSRRSRSKIGST